jgi:hypothetical protein
VNTDVSWRAMYLVGGIAALIALAGTLTDIALAMVPGWEASTVPASIQAWFAQFQSKPLLALRNLDLLNAVISTIQIPVIFALFAAHRRTRPALAGLALIVVLVGTAVYLTSNVALPMLDLANRYSIAASDSGRRALEAAGLALLARGAHGSMGFFVGLFLSSLGTLLMSLAVLLGRVFSRITGGVGLAGIGLLMVYTIVFTFLPEPGPAMMVFAMPGGLLMLVWNVLIARKLLQLSAAGDT